MVWLVSHLRHTSAILVGSCRWMHLRRPVTPLWFYQTMTYFLSAGTRCVDFPGVISVRFSSGAIEILSTRSWTSRWTTWTWDSIEASLTWRANDSRQTARSLHVGHCASNSARYSTPNLTLWRSLLQLQSIMCHTVICNFWHLGTLTLTAKHQSAQMSMALVRDYCQILCHHAKSCENQTSPLTFHNMAAVAILKF